MLVGYSDKRTEKICTDFKFATKNIGSLNARKLVQRIQWLSAADNLHFFNDSYKFLKLHKLNGQYDGMYALNITKQYRLIFYPCDINGNPYDGVDFKVVSVVTIQEVSKHYE